MEYSALIPSGLKSFLRGWAGLRLAQALFCLNAAIWLAFGLITLARMRAAPSASPLALAVIAVMMAGNAAAMLVSAAMLALRRRLAQAFALAVLLANILLTFTDQFGLFDLLTLLLDLVLLVLVVILLCGGDKATQDRDIQKAHEIARNLKEQE